MNAHWPVKRLGEVFEIARGGSPRPIEMFVTKDPDGLNWIKIGDASASGKYIEKTKEKIKREGLSKTRYVEPGDFLLTNSMSFGRPYIMATDGCIHDGWLVLKPRNRESVYPDYFYHLLGSDAVYGQFAARAGGSTVKNLNSEIVSSIEVKLPPFDEQRRIAAILDKADALRRKRKRALELLDDASNHALELHIDRLAKGKLRKLGESLEFITTGGRSWSKYYQEKGARFIRSLDVQMNSISEEAPVFVSAPDNAEAKRTRTKPGDVLLTVTGSRIGRVSALPDELRGSYISQHVAILRPKPRLHPKFLSYFLSSSRGQRQIAKWQYGQTKPGLNFAQIGGFEIPDIGVEHQSLVEGMLKNFETAVSVQRSQQIKFEMLFSSLQHRAFSGQL